jgi:hypothetical protein
MKMGESQTWWTGARRSLAIGFDSGTGSLCCWSVAAYGQGGNMRFCETIFVKFSEGNWHLPEEYGWCA